MLRVYLDDLRPIPDGYFGFRDAKSCIEFCLENFNLLDEISLDHDLGDDVIFGTGYDVILALEEYVINNDVERIPVIKIHSSNSSARQKMELGIKSIQKIFENK